MRYIKIIIVSIIASNAKLLVDLFWKGDFWLLKKSCKNNYSKLKYIIYNGYLQSHGAWIGLKSEIGDPPPHCPHGIYGIFISKNAVIGKSVVIFQHVTIGSNTLKESKKYGSPKIGDACYIGSGAKIIGNINIGSNSRIGANCIVVKDIPENSTCVLKGTEIITNIETLDNTFYPAK